MQGEGAYCLGCDGTERKPRQGWHEHKERIEGMNLSFDGHVCISSWRDWDDENNWNVFKKPNGMEPKDIGCVVSFRGIKNAYADIYAESQGKVRNLVARHLPSKVVERGEGEMVCFQLLQVLIYSIL